MSRSRRTRTITKAATAKRAPAESRNETRGFLGCLRAELALVAGIITTIVFFTVGKGWLADLDDPMWSLAMFTWLFGVMIWCAFGVVRLADALAELLGEPYGTSILTVSVISIEATILAAIMLGGSPKPTLPRESSGYVSLVVYRVF